MGPNRDLRCSEYDNNLNTINRISEMKKFEELYIAGLLVMFVFGAGEVINWIINTIIQ